MNNDGDDDDWMDDGDRQGQAFVWLSDFYETVLPNLRSSTAAAPSRVTLHHSFGNAQARELGQALLQRTLNHTDCECEAAAMAYVGVKRLDLYFESLRQVPRQLDDTNVGYSSRYTQMEADDDDNDDDMTPLLAYLANSPSGLELVTADLSLSQPELVRRFFLAMSCPTCHVHALQIVNLQDPAHMEGLAALMRSTHSIRDFSLEDRGYGGNVTAGQQLADAFGNNTSLQKLTLWHQDPSVESTLVAESNGLLTPLILERLPCHPALRHLCLSTRASSHQLFTSMSASALRPLCRLPPHLVHLELKFYDFNNNSDVFQYIYEGFGQCKTIQKLTIQGCQFNEASTNLVRDLLITTTSPAPGRRHNGAMIRSLHLGRNNTFLPADHNSMNHLLGPVFLNCTGQFPAQQLEELVVFDSDDTSLVFTVNDHDNRNDDDISNLSGIVAALGQNATAVKLRLLSVDSMNFCEFEGLVSILSMLIHLRELYVGNVPQRCFQILGDKFVEQMKRNGGLRNVQVGQTQGFSRAQLAMIELYCRRNRSMAQIMRRPRLDYDHTDTTTIPISLFPKLFSNADECPAVGPTWVLAGLLSAGARIGSGVSRQQYSDS